MNAVTPTAQMTADEFFALPYDAGARWRQLIEGELVVCSPSWLHNSAQGSILFALESWRRAGPARGAQGSNVWVAGTDVAVVAAHERERALVDVSECADPVPLELVSPEPVLGLPGKRRSRRRQHRSQRRDAVRGYGVHRRTGVNGAC